MMRRRPLLACLDSGASYPPHLTSLYAQARRNPVIQTALESRVREEKLTQLESAKGHNIVKVRVVDPDICTCALCSVYLRGYEGR